MQHRYAWNRVALGLERAELRQQRLVGLEKSDGEILRWASVCRLVQRRVPDTWHERERESSAGVLP